LAFCICDYITEYHKRNFVVKYEGDSLVRNQYVKKPKEKNERDMADNIHTF